MTVKLDLNPDLEQQVRARAAAHGVSLEVYLLSLIAEASLPVTPAEATLEEFEAAMDAFSEGTEALPVLPEEAFSRESIYEGR
jgi:plasmid stability protein